MVQKNERGKENDLTLLDHFASFLNISNDVLTEHGIHEAKYLGRKVIAIPRKRMSGVDFAKDFYALLNGEFQYSGSNKEPGTVPMGAWRLRSTKNDEHVFIVNSVFDMLRLADKSIPSIAVEEVAGFEPLSEQDFVSPAQFVVVNPELRFKDPPPINVLDFITEMKQVSTGGEPIAQLAQEQAGSLSAWLAERVDAINPVLLGWAIDKQQRIQELRASCKKLLKSKDLLAELTEPLKKLGYAGSTDIAFLTYLVMSSRVFEKPVALSFHGAPGVGKSFVIEKVSAFFPETEVISGSTLTPASLSYWGDGLQHKVFVVGEEDGMHNRQVRYVLRILISEGKIVHIYTVAVPGGGRVTKTTKTDASIAAITTTTREKLDPHLDSRVLRIEISDDPELTERIVRASAEVGYKVPQELIDFQELFALEATDVAIPFKAELTATVSYLNRRMRRDIDKVLTLIRTHALLHRESRECDENGRVVATREDYEVIYRLLDSILTRMAELSVHETERKIVETVKEFSSKEDFDTTNGVSQTQIAEHMGVHKSTVNRHLPSCLNEGWLVKAQKSGPRNASRVSLGDIPMPEAQSVLPKPDVVFGTPKNSSKSKKANA